MFFGSVGDSLPTVQAVLFISCSTHHQAFSFQTLTSLLGSRNIWSLTPLRKHVLQAKRSLGQRHHICVRLSSQHNWCSPYICWCFDTSQVIKSFKSTTEPAKIQKYMPSDQNNLQDHTLTARNARNVACHTPSPSCVHSITALPSTWMLGDSSHRRFHASRGATGCNYRVFLFLPSHRTTSFKPCIRTSDDEPQSTWISLITELHHKLLLKSVLGWLPMLCSSGNDASISTSSQQRHWVCTWHGVLNPFYLFTLDVILYLGYLDLHGIQFLIRYQWDIGHCLRLIHHLETKVSERDVPFAVILLAFSERQTLQTFYYYWCLASPTPPSHKSFPAIVRKIQKWAQLHCGSHVEKAW